ncbi:MAG: transposase [Planctomycetes bacterium]|nr:transposase [Planctomycetota bacterium]
MTLEQIAALGRKVSWFLGLFADCFGRRDARRLLKVYVTGQLSNLRRKNVEAIALQAKTAPRTLQRFLESIKWDEQKLRNRCQQIIAKDHAHDEAIGCVDESGTAKSGQETVGVNRQWNGNRGKVDNCAVAVHLSYSAPGFQVLLDSTVYLPEDWANDPARRKKHTCPTKSSSAPNRRSRWSRSTALCPMAYASRLGRSTSCTVATASFSTAWNRDGRCLWAKYQPTFTVGYSRQPCCELVRTRRENAGVRRNIRVWRVVGLRAKSATC